MLAPDNKPVKLLSDKLMSDFRDKEWYISGEVYIVSGDGVQRHEFNSEYGMMQVFAQSSQGGCYADTDC